MRASDLLVAAPARARQVDLGDVQQRDLGGVERGGRVTHASQPPSVIHASTFRSRATARP